MMRRAWSMRYSSALSMTFRSASGRATDARMRSLQAAQDVLAQHWRDQYALYVLCAVLVMVVYYTSSSSMRHTQRRCEAAEHHCREELDVLRETMRGMLERWEREMIQRDDQMIVIQKQNMDMTRSVDQMTYALKKCTPRA